MKFLILNAGSSSQKSCLYELAGDRLPETVPEPLWEAFIDWTVLENQGRLMVETPGQKQVIILETGDRQQGIAQMLDTLVTGDCAVLKSLTEIDLVGHRVVHGGTDYAAATLITPAVKQAIADLIPLAPAHNPAHLEGIEAIGEQLGDVPQIAVFDTAFHRTIPTAAAEYPIPQAWTELGIRRYGFHGTSHKYCAQKTAEILGQPLAELKLITCHIGNGASLTAIRNGVSIDTTMGFTPLEGLMMGARSGSIDPAIVLFLQQTQGLTPAEINATLNKKSGLLGVSGRSADLRTILQAKAEGDEQAQLAYTMYIHRFRRCLGAMVASLEGLDTLVFTAGVGENAATVRADVCQAFQFLGLKLDPELNDRSPRDTVISHSDSLVNVVIVHTEEDWAIAQDCWHWWHSQGLGKKP
ncbi:acetate kinase [Synechocystis sp. PCC 7339]|uniref:acetate kinase n=1 Tax=unclassified Synechocystis TaxID=2640012 RepID=UPI001BAFA5A8|nr:MULTISPECIES: acetate kinase [unclassified Synechocystis]QUS59396.1 acetate kinase [Synechocystis sp. PCC 7338]UAJ71579.1 acetate kinase [Synechocystis sp. PCC 7339]